MLLLCYLLDSINMSHELTANDVEGGNVLAMLIFQV